MWDWLLGPAIKSAKDVEKHFKIPGNDVFLKGAHGYGDIHHVTGVDAAGNRVQVNGKWMSFSEFKKTYNV